MSDPYSNPPKLGATFMPGGFDDFSVLTPPAPDVVSPAPQKHMPEVPAQMQDNLAQLELSAISQGYLQASQVAGSGTSAANPAGSQSSPQVLRKPARPFTYTREGSYLQHRAGGHPNQSSEPAVVQPVTSAPSMMASQAEIPNFTAFPKIHNRGPNVPPSDEERLAIIENARVTVLSSPDPEQQLIWAQDALNYVDVSADQNRRLSQLQSWRPSTPKVEYQIREDAKNIVQFLADQSHPKATFMKGQWLEFGKFGFKEDRKEAFHCYSKAAKDGYSRAEYRIGMQFESTNEPMQALQHYFRGRDAGDSASCYRMGMMSLLGQLGQPQDFQVAVHLIRQAAENADENAPQGAYVFGMLQAQELPQIKVPGVFLSTNQPSARQYIEKAAFLGFSKAQVKMGSAYELCSLGCDFNPALSLHYSALAARQGDPEAEMSISKWFLCGYEGLFHKNDELAYTYAERAALAELPNAQFAVGYFNEIGVCVPVNLTKALEWYQKAAQRGSKDASGRIESIQKAGPMSKSDHEKVAVSRIKSQHGSQRGQRPARFMKPVQPMPPVAEPVSSSGTPIPNVPRSGSVPPYPVDDRPISTAPYPLDDGPSNTSLRPPPSAGFLRTNQRPISLNSNHNISQGAIANVLARRSYDGLRNPSNPPAGGQPVRPYTVTNGVVDATSRFTNEQRISSAPPQKSSSPRPPTHQTAPPYSGGRRVPNKSPQRASVGMVSQHAIQSQRPQYGFQNSSTSAYSQDFLRPESGAKPNSPAVSNLPPVPAKSPLTPTSPALQSTPHAWPSTPDTQKTPMMSGGLPPQATTPKPVEHSGPKTTKKNAAAGKQEAPAITTAPIRPPQKGPRTFEEMGVPQAKQEQDCTVM